MSSSISSSNNSFISYFVIRPLPSRSNNLKDYSILLLLRVFSLLTEAVINSLKSTLPDPLASNYGNNSSTTVSAANLSPL